MVQLKQSLIRKLDSSTWKDIEKWLCSVPNDNLNLDKLREYYPQLPDYFGTPNYDAHFQDATGQTVVPCGACSLPTFEMQTVSVYLGAHSICEKCHRFYSYCQQCKTLVLTHDLGNPTHIHVAPSRTSLLFAEDGPVEVWNADIMTSTRKAFLRTDKEHLIWKHQKEARHDVLFPAHREISFRYFGIELEVEKLPGGPPDLINRTRKLIGEFAMVKHDGSLSNHGKDGFEIVTVPATMAYHQSGVWDKFFDLLGYYFINSPSTAGLHVHVGLGTVGKITASKIAVFANSLKNREFMESIAERDLGVANPNGKVYANVKDGWKLSDMFSLRQHTPDCVWNPKNKRTMSHYAVTEKGELKKDKMGHPIIASIKPSQVVVRPVCKCPEGVYNIDKYHAFNPTTKRPTIELRIFRGKVDKNFLYSALEFSDALVDFCNETSPANLDYKTFLNWICRYNPSGHATLYPHLSRLLINKSWIDPPKEVKS